MKTAKEVLSLALVKYESGETLFMCHAVEDLQSDETLITREECDTTLIFIKESLYGRTTLTDYLFDNHTEYSTLIGENHKFETPEALEYRVNWWRELIKTV